MTKENKMNNGFRAGRSLAVIALALVLPLRAGAGERVYQVRTVEDPTVEGDLAFCQSQDFWFLETGTKRVLLPAKIWVHRTRSVDGQVVNDSAVAVGTATGCVKLTNFVFPPGLDQEFALKLNMPSGTYEARGQCTIISNNVPQAGLVLAGCHLRMTRFPAGIVGGSATSSSVFNPFRLTGFNTGSYWTLHLYDTAVGPDDLIDHSSHDHDMRTIEDAAAAVQSTGAPAL
jgi:hypothetical protein